jgi:uncharacterized protein
MNRLQYENSPYLLQHAHNPVDWYAWNEEAFARAKAEDKPILVSIGYSTCHWCHVMERESFEDTTTAAFMNEHFVCIKVDREERPDVDHIYMEMVQILSGQGGWPLNCFLLPDGRPFFGGTYYPPQPLYNRPSWLQVMSNISNAYQTKREVVEGQAAQLMGYVEKSDEKLLTPITADFVANFDKNSDEIFEKMQERFDTSEGGFGGAPKFPGAMCLDFLLAYHHFSKEKNALAHVELSLDKMCQGGIYDQLGGGFARYATDRAWLIPHFEKMLYDNALLVSVLAKTYKVTQKKLYAETITETLSFVEREMTSEEGGFYSALDADSEGVEGKFYVWQKAEVDAILGEDSSLFCAFYDVSEEGNWEEQSILWRAENFDFFAQKNNINEDFLRQKMSEARAKLFAVRSERVRPSLDDKILLAWNALMCSAYTHAFQALQEEKYRTVALRNIDFLIEKFEQTTPNHFFHTYKNELAKYEANLEDYSYLIAALLDVYEICFDKKYLTKAKALSEIVIENFYDAASGLFYFAPISQKDLIVRRKELYDNAMPSGNATMAHNLQRLAIIFEKNDWKKIVQSLLKAIENTAKRYATSFARYALVMLLEEKNYREIAIIGTDALEKIQAIQTHFFPNAIFMASQNADSEYAMLKDKNEDYIYLCQNYACLKPVQSVEEFLKIAL